MNGSQEQKSEINILQSVVDKSQGIKYKFNQLLSKFKLTNYKVAVINSPFQSPENVDIKSVHAKTYHLYPPLGLWYNCQSIDSVDNFHSVPIDLNLMMLESAATGKDYSFRNLIDRIPEDFDMYLISCMFSSSANIYNEICRLIEKRGKLRIVGGVHATGCYEDFLKGNLAEIVIKNESEQQIINLLKYLGGNSNVELNNLSFLSNGEVVSFEDIPRKNVKRQDILPQLIKAKDSIPKYSEYGGLGHFNKAFGNNRRAFTLQANRGCRSACTYCSVRNFMGWSVRTPDEDVLVKTIKYLYDECGISHIDWLDDDILADRDKAISLFNKIADLKLDLVFTVTNGVLARDITEEAIDAIARAGFIHIGFGVESGSDEIRKHIHRTTNLKNLDFTIKILQEKYPHIFIHLNFMIGFPNETMGQIVETFNYASSFKVDWCQLAVVQALPNTPMHDEFVALGDPRVSNSNKYSPASESKHKGVPLEDIGLRAVDIFSMPRDKIPTFKELNDIWYPINTRLNFLENKNLDSKEQIWKLRNVSKVMHECYPSDAIMPYTLAKCYSMEGDNINASKYLQIARENTKKSKFWTEFLAYLKQFDKHDIIK